MIEISFLIFFESTRETDEQIALNVFIGTDLNESTRGRLSQLSALCKELTADELKTLRNFELETRDGKVTLKDDELYDPKALPDVLFKKFKRAHLTIKLNYMIAPIEHLYSSAAEAVKEIEKILEDLGDA